MLPRSLSLGLPRTREGDKGETHPELRAFGVDSRWKAQSAYETSLSWRAMQWNRAIDSARASASRAAGVQRGQSAL
jgi:hypothetical protein